MVGYVRCKILGKVLFNDHTVEQRLENREIMFSAWSCRKDRNREQSVIIKLTKSPVIYHSLDFYTFRDYKRKINKYIDIVIVL